MCQRCGRISEGDWPWTCTLKAGSPRMVLCLVHTVSSCPQICLILNTQLWFFPWIPRRSSNTWRKERSLVHSSFSILEAIAYQIPGVQSMFWATPEKSCNVPGVTWLRPHAGVLLTCLVTQPHSGTVCAQMGPGIILSQLHHGLIPIWISLLTLGEAGAILCSIHRCLEVMYIIPGSRHRLVGARRWKATDKCSLLCLWDSFCIF